MVNGSPIAEFNLSKGIGRRDLIAPFLFVIVVEGLVGIKRQVTKLKKLERVKIRRNDTKINMPNMFMIHYLVLRCFEIAPGLKVNFFKGKLGRIGVNNDTLGKYAAMLNC